MVMCWAQTLDYSDVRLMRNLRSILAICWSKSHLWIRFNTVCMDSVGYRFVNVDWNAVTRFFAVTLRSVHTSRISPHLVRTELNCTAYPVQVQSRWDQLVWCEQSFRIFEIRRLGWINMWYAARSAALPFEIIDRSSVRPNSNLKKHKGSFTSHWLTSSRPNLDRIGYAVQLSSVQRSSSWISIHIRAVV